MRDVCIQDGKVVADVPPDARRIDARGMVVMPGGVDIHCHIAGPEFAADLDAVIARAREAGVDRALVILAADDAPELMQAGEVASKWPDARFSIGVHPHAAGRFAGDPAGAAAAETQTISVLRHRRSRTAMMPKMSDPMPIGT